MHSIVGDIVFLAVVLLTASISGEFIVPSETRGFIGGTARLQCKIEGMRWYVITWVRLHKDGSTEILVNFPSDTKTPDWSSTVDRKLKKRLRERITVESGLAEFNLELSDLECADGGKYACRFTGNDGLKEKTVTVKLEAKPAKPEIHYDYLVIEVNTTFKVECEADVGFPPRQLTWLSKPKGNGEFRIAENVYDQVETTSEACHVSAKRALDIFVDGNSNGSIYRCAFEGDYDNEQLYDEVSVQLPVVKIQTAPPTCPEGGCLAESKDEDGNGTILTSKFSAVLMLISLCVVFL